MVGAISSPTKIWSILSCLSPSANPFHVPPSARTVSALLYASTNIPESTIVFAADTGVVLRVELKSPASITGSCSVLMLVICERRAFAWST